MTLTGAVSTIDQLIPANDTGQVLGIYTSSGNIQLANRQSNGNLEIDASIATISATGSGGIVNTGNSINTLTIVGGRIQNTIQNIGATTRNVLFDRRFLTGSLRRGSRPRRLRRGRASVARQWSPGRARSGSTRPTTNEIVQQQPPKAKGRGAPTPRPFLFV